RRDAQQLGTVAAHRVGDGRGGVAQAFQSQVVLHEFELAGQRHALGVGFVEGVAQQVG
nr:hypothetical protein [Tanacetum cinerariifolium]